MFILNAKERLATSILRHNNNCMPAFFLCREMLRRFSNMTVFTAYSTFRVLISQRIVTEQNTLNGDSLVLAET